MTTYSPGLSKNEDLSVQLENSLGTIINPATEDKQDNIILALTTNYTLRLAESGSYTYIGEATIGASTANAVWRVKRLDETSGLVILFADGNANFDNIWDNYATLTYS